jgi:hypothetical protein
MVAANRIAHCPVQTFLLNEPNSILDLAGLELDKVQPPSPLYILGNGLL